MHTISILYSKCTIIIPLTRDAHCKLFPYNNIIIYAVDSKTTNKYLAFSYFLLLIYKAFKLIDVAKNCFFLPLGLCGPVHTVILATHKPVTAGGKKRKENNKV